MTTGLREQDPRNPPQEPYASAFRQLQRATDPREIEDLLLNRICVDWEVERGRFRHSCVTALDTVEHARRVFGPTASIMNLLENILLLGRTMRRDPQAVRITREQEYAFSEMYRYSNDNQTLARFHRQGIMTRRILGNPWADPNHAPETITEQQIWMDPAEVFTAFADNNVAIPGDLESFRRFVLSHQEESDGRAWPDGTYASRNMDTLPRIRFDNNALNNRIDAYTMGIDLAIANHHTPEAKAKALDLLKRVLSASQFKCYEIQLLIEVEGKRFDYIIRKVGQTLIRNKKTVGSAPYSACLQFMNIETPPEDRVVMEYLLIKNDEDRYLSTANVFEPRQGNRQVPASELGVVDIRLQSQLHAQIFEIYGNIFRLAAQQARTMFNVQGV